MGIGGKMIQIPQCCVNYTKNENMNKTCKGENMCRIYYGEQCKEYRENEYNTNTSDKNNKHD